MLIEAPPLRRTSGLECSTEALHHIALALHDRGGLRRLARGAVGSLDMKRRPINQEGAEPHRIRHERRLHLRPAASIEARWLRG